jgi:hypothetical protein
MLAFGVTLLNIILLVQSHLFTLIDSLKTVFAMSMKIINSIETISTQVVVLAQHAMVPHSNGRT